MSRRRFISSTIAGSSLFTAIGCGTVLHPERRGQPAGPLDWKIVALDAVGLLLFFVPGVIAFAVDFNNGSIYLPPDSHRMSRRDRAAKHLVTVKFSEKKLTVQKLEEIVSKHTDQGIHLSPGYYHTEELKSIDEFWKTADKHQDEWENFQS